MASGTAYDPSLIVMVGITNSSRVQSGMTSEKKASPFMVSLCGPQVRALSSKLAHLAQVESRVSDDSGIVISRFGGGCCLQQAH